MVEKPPVKKKPGRPPKKVGVVNPDNILATRGYVKCIARKIHVHHHKIDNDSWLPAIAAFIGMIVITYLIVFSKGLIPEWAYWIVVVFTVIEIIHTNDRSDIGNHYTCSPQDLPILDKWEEPEECEEEDECC